jgi:hypothetical protein
MGKQDRPLEIDLPRPAADQPAWSKVGIIGVAGFLVGILWPRVAGLKIGPSVPVDLHGTTEASVAPSGSPLSPSALPGARPPAPSGAPSSEPTGSQELVVVGPGKITRCFDKKDRKVDDCEKLQFDPIALPKLKDLAKCPSAVGLEGKVALGIEVNFDRKEVGVSRMKKGTSLPVSTVLGILQCAGKDFANVALDEVPHKYRRYAMVYVTTFYPPGKHPDDAKEGASTGADADDAAGATTDATTVNGTATDIQDTALVRKTPKEGHNVAR